MPADCPLRGPAEHRAGEFTYRNTWPGDVARFTGVARLTPGPMVVYEATYCGGVVDRRRGV
jgi:hypothetical protein